MTAIPEILDLYIGWDAREVAAFNVLRGSLERRTSRPLHIVPLMVSPLRYDGKYWRKHEKRDGRLWDTISDAPMSTEFAITRFLVPHLQTEGWALYLDCDMLALADVAELFALADDRYALMCVQHNYFPRSAAKMDGQAQQPYPRKNWSSVMLWNCAHPAHQALSLEVVNSWPGRELHRFDWLDDSVIGELPLEWNYLVGELPPLSAPKLVHFTNGYPEMPGCDAVHFAEAWRRERRLIDHLHASAPRR